MPRALFSWKHHKSLLLGHRLHGPRRCSGSLLLLLLRWLRRKEEGLRLVLLLRLLLRLLLGRLLLGGELHRLPLHDELRRRRAALLRGLLLLLLLLVVHGHHYVAGRQDELLLRLATGGGLVWGRLVRVVLR